MTTHTDTEALDMDKLEERVREIASEPNGVLRGRYLDRLKPIDVILNLIAEVRQERERADADVQRLAETFNENLALKAALSCAEETIEKVRVEVQDFEQSDNDAMVEIEHILTEYDKQKGADRG